MKPDENFIKTIKREVEGSPAPAGRPPTYGTSMRQVSIFLPIEMIEWLRTKPNRSEYIRGLISRAMQDENKNESSAQGDKNVQIF